MEATLRQGDIFKKIISAVGDLVQDANFECNSEGIRLQAMDSSHVSLVSLFLSKESFEDYKCEIPMNIGINFASLNKLLKCSKSGDALTLQCESTSSDELSLIFTDENNRRTSRFELKLMEIDSERLVIPDTEYKCVIRIDSKEFKALCSDLHNIGDSIQIAGTKEGARFSLSGDIGSGSITFKAIDTLTECKAADDEDMDNEIEEGCVDIKCVEPVTQNFALRYLVFFSKANSLSAYVNLYMSPDIPLVVEYTIDQLGHLKYYLAPKIDEDEP